MTVTVTTMRTSYSYKSQCLALLATSLVAGTVSACGDNGLASFDTTDHNAISTDGGVDAASTPSCAEMAYKASTLPLDIVLLLDRSNEMAQGNRWEVASRAISDFLDRGFPAPTRVALTLVPFLGFESTVFDNTAPQPDFCQYRAYRDFVVPMGEASTQRALVESAFANSQGPGGWGGATSPLSASLEGTYFAATKVQEEHPDHQVVVLYVGAGRALPCDGYGGSLTTDPTVIAKFADSALRYNGIRTFAVVVDGANRVALSIIAKAGGGEAFVPSKETSESMLEAMLGVTKSAIDCAYALPEPPSGSAIDPSTLRVELSLSTGERSVIPAAAQTGCDATGGWFYDNMAQPTKVIFCPQTCSALRETSSPRVELVVGCNSTVF